MKLTSFFAKSKNSKLSEYTPMILITVLLICQIIVSYYISYTQNISNHFTRVSQVMCVQHASEESQSISTATLAANIIADSEILKLTETPNCVSNSFEISKRLRKYMTINGSVSNIYLYKHNNAFLCDVNTNKSYDGNIVPSHKVVFDCIKQYKESGKTNFYYFDSADSTGSKYLYKVFISTNNPDDLVITKENYYNLARPYINISYDLQSEVIITDADGNTVFGDTEFDIFSYLNSDKKYKLTHSGALYDDITYKNKRYISVYSYSSELDRYYVMLTPKSSVVSNGFLNRNYVYTYICIFLSLLTLIRVFSLWQKFRLKLLSSHTKAHQTESKISLHSCLAEDSDDSKALLLSYINEKAPDAQLASVMLIKIDNSRHLHETYSQPDFDLIKYGMNNICAEIFTNHGFNVMMSSDAEDMLEYIILKNSSDRFEKECVNAAKECMSALNKYIYMNTSYFIGSPLSVKDIHQSYENALRIFEYSFIRGADSILLTDDIKSVSPEDFLTAKASCDTIKANIIENSADFSENLGSLKALTENMNPSQIREILYNLIISMYSAVEHLEHKLNVLVIFDVSSCFSLLEKAQFSTEIFDIADNLYRDVAARLSDRNKNNNSPLVTQCMDIIKENYRDENLSVEEIARRLSFSANYLGRKFKQLTGSSIATVITETRLDAAAELIVSSNDKIQDIIKCVGITNSSHFTALFRKRFGDSPINYRHNHRNKQ